MFLICLNLFMKIVKFSSILLCIYLINWIDSLVIMIGIGSYQHHDNFILRLRVLSWRNSKTLIEAKTVVTTLFYFILNLHFIYLLFGSIFYCTYQVDAIYLSGITLILNKLSLSIFLKDYIKSRDKKNDEISDIK